MFCLFSQMAMSDSNNTDLSVGLTNHKRSHSFNNHQSYTQHSHQQTHKNKQKNQSARWLLNSCDSLDQSPAKTNKNPIGKKFSSVDFIDTAGENYSNKGKIRFMSLIRKRKCSKTKSLLTCSCHCNYYCIMKCLYFLCEGL